MAKVFDCSPIIWEGNGKKIRGGNYGDLQTALKAAEEESP
jgi:hypothetical protein